MAKQHKTTSKEWNRPTYQGKDFARATSAAPAWAFGCELCNFNFGVQDDGRFCTCQAGQARARLARGQMTPIEDDVHVPTFNAAYGGGE